MEERVAITPGIVDPRWVVEACAASLGVTADAKALADALAAFPERPDPATAAALLERLATVARLRVERIEASVEDAIAQATVRLPVVVPTRDGSFLLVLGRTGPRARVRTGPDQEAVIPVAEVTAAAAGPALHLELSLPFDPYAHDGHEHPTPWARLWRLVLTEREDLWIVAIYAVAVGVLSLVMPLAVQTLVNTVVFGTFLQPLFWLSVLALAGTSMAAALQLAQIRVVETLKRRVFVRLVADLAHRLPRIRTDVLDREHTQILINRFFDVLTLQKTLATLLLDGVSVVIAGVAGTLLLAIYSPWFLFYAAALWVSLAGMLVVTGRRAPATAIEASYAKHEVAGWMEQVASNPGLFRHGGVSAWAETRADALSRKYLAARDAHFQIWFRQVAGLLLFAAIASTALLGLGGWLVVAGSLSVGQLLAAELVVSVVLGSFAKLGKQLESLYDLLAALDKIGHLLDLPLEPTRGSPLPSTEGPLAVSASDVSYALPDGRVLFEGLAFSARAGERLAVTGAPGSGRSTLLDLLAGARSPASGHVRVDGVDLREVDLAALRRRVVEVRGVELVAGSVADNVRVGRRGITDAQVRAALARVGLLEAVAALPEGVWTELGPGGKPMSGTQVRLLVLARALVARPGLVLVDELVDQLPPEARDIVLDAILGASRDHTVVVVTRDPAVAARCDRQLTFERPERAFTARVRVEGGGAWAR